MNKITKTLLPIFLISGLALGVLLIGKKTFFKPKATLEEVTLNYNLKAGWNLVGLPFDELTKTPASVLNTNNGCMGIAYYSVPLSSYQLYYSNPAWSVTNPLNELIGGKVYFVWCPNDNQAAFTIRAKRLDWSQLAVRLEPLPTSSPAKKVFFIPVPTDSTASKASEFVSEASTKLSSPNQQISCTKLARYNRINNSWDIESVQISNNPAADFTIDKTSGYLLGCNQVAATPPTQSVSYPSAFSGVQGQNNLYYLGVDKNGNYSQASFDGSKWTVLGADRNFDIHAGSLAPAFNYNAIVRWVAVQAGNINIRGSFTRDSTNRGDSDSGRDVITSFYVKKGSATLWQKGIGNTTDLQSFNLTTTVSQGDNIEFWVDANNDSGWDSSKLDFTINYAQ